MQKALPKRPTTSLLANRLRNNARIANGFSIVESILSALLLSVLISLGMTISTMVENAKYEANLRDAARQAIDNDVEMFKNYLFSLDYVPPSSTSNQSSDACYRSNTNCKRGGAALNIASICRDYAQRAINTAPGGPATFISLQAGDISTFGSSPFRIRRILTVHSPHSSGRYTLDSSIVRGTYRLDNNTSRKIGLSSNTSSEILRTVDFYPNAHPYCNPE